MHEELLADEVAQPMRMSYLEFMFQSLGMRYTFLLPAAALLAFVLVLVLVLRGKGPALVGALIFIVPLPILIGIIGVVDGILASFQVIAMSGTSPKPSEWAQGIAMSLMTFWVGLLLAVPSYLLATIGLIVRSLTGKLALSDQPLPAKLV